MTSTRGTAFMVIKPRLKNWIGTIWASDAFGQNSVDSVWLDPAAPKA